MYILLRNLGPSWSSSYILQAGYKLYRVCYEHDRWQSVCSDIPKPTEESSLISVDSYTTDTFVTATFLCKLNFLKKCKTNDFIKLPPVLPCCTVLLFIAPIGWHI